MPPVIFRQGSGRVVSSVLRFATGTLTQSAGEAVYTPPGGGGGGGPWGSTGITGTANRFAIFDGTGSPSFLAYPSTGLVAWTGTAWAATTIDAPLAYSGGHLSVDLSAYLTTASASSTYLTISSAASSYQPLDSDLTGLAGLEMGCPIGRQEFGRHPQIIYRPWQALTAHLDLQMFMLPRLTHD